MAENDPDAQQLVLEVTVAKALEAVRTGQVDLAIQDLTALRDKDPNQAEVRLGLAKAYIAKRQADRRDGRAAEGRGAGRRPTPRRSTSSASSST